MLQQQQEQADCLNLSFDERLALLVQREVYARGDRKRARLLQRAQLKYPTATLEDASFEAVRGIDRSTLMGVALSTWIERGETLTFAGATGAGQDVVGLRAGPVRLSPGALGAVPEGATSGRGASHPPRRRHLPTLARTACQGRRVDPGRLGNGSDGQCHPG